MNPAQQLKRTLDEFRKACNQLQVPGHQDAKSGRRHSVSRVTHKQEPKEGDHQETEHKDKDRPVTSIPNMGRRKSVPLTTDTAEAARSATTSVKKERKVSVSVKGGSVSHKPVQQSKSWNHSTTGVSQSHNVTIVIQDGRIVERRKSLPADDLEDGNPEGSPTLHREVTGPRSPNGHVSATSSPVSPVKGKKPATRTSSLQHSPTPTHKKWSRSLPGAFSSEQRFLYKKDSTLVAVPTSSVTLQRVRSDSLHKRGKSASLFPEGVKEDFFPDIQPPVFSEDGLVVPSSPLALSRGVCTRYFHLQAGEATDGCEKTSDLPSPRRMTLPNIRKEGESPRKEHKMGHDDSNRRHSLSVLTNRPHHSFVTIDDLRPAAKYEIRASEPGDRTSNHLPENWLEEMKKCRYLRMPNELAHRLGYDWE